MDSETRHIRKYANRRLYDTAESRYVTLVEIRQLVLAQVDFTVLEKHTATDITRNVLIQVLTEQELGTDPVMSNEVLTGIIRGYGTPAQSGIADALDESVKQFG